MDRGEMLRTLLKEKKSDDCWLCNDLVAEIPHFADLISDSLKTFEFDSFLVGCKIDEDIISREQEILNFTKSEYNESIKSELTREIGKILEPRLNKEVEFENPTIMAIVDTMFDVVSLQIKSLFIYGRYKKFNRNIPQTRWFCKFCRGKGCRKCSYTGKLYETSVEELISEPFLKATKGDDEAFHGCGREDIDALMLGNGRPFVLEIKNPQIRSLDLSELEKKINSKYKDKVEVSNLRFSNREEIARIKKSEFQKTYKVVIRCKRAVNIEKLKKVALSLQGTTIGQFTPSRVAHRRANTVREKKIYNCKVESVEDTIATLKIEAESGTYIKELISGDDGKTKPNISEMLGVPCQVVELDVIEIKGE